MFRDTFHIRSTLKIDPSHEGPCFSQRREKMKTTCENCEKKWVVREEWCVPCAATISILVSVLGYLIGHFLCGLNPTVSFLLGIVFFFCYVHFEIWRNREDSYLKTSDDKEGESDDNV